MWDTLEQELDYRRTLMQAAAMGDVQAQAEVEREYGVRIYRQAESLDDDIIGSSDTSMP